ncbi:hypothetical protein EC912_101573 [Luteibacter rhizovicinus]|uniref:Uncharacterized protein n=1 Tax=Luteibacter rhizovicinus TaxID=242606 RepID=A0A4R3YY84_9GAMM|nr:hypothetical protein EC912_101573 [Luteibacter rhizovicinus]
MALPLPMQHISTGLGQPVFAATHSWRPPTHLSGHAVNPGGNGLPARPPLIRTMA